MSKLFIRHPTWQAGPCLSCQPDDKARTSIARPSRLPQSLPSSTSFKRSASSSTVTGLPRDT
jgi:hypothetical protein